MKIHHATAKRAAKFGIELKLDGDTFTAGTAERGVLARGASAAECLAVALRELGLGTEKKAPKVRKAKAKKTRKVASEEDGDEDEEEGGDHSVVKRKYRTRYRPFKMTCGDSLAKDIRKEFYVAVDGGTPEFDWDRFVKFAKANDCWKSDYLKLNKGMRRMNAINRLRAKVKAGHKISW